MPCPFIPAIRNNCMVFKTLGKLFLSHSELVVGTVSLPPWGEKKIQNAWTRHSSYHTFLGGHIQHFAFTFSQEYLIVVFPKGSPRQCFFIHCYLSQPKQEYFFFFLPPLLVFCSCYRDGVYEAKHFLTISDHRLCRFCPKKTLVIGNWMLSVPSRSKVRWQGWKEQRLYLPGGRGAWWWEPRRGQGGNDSIPLPEQLSLCGGAVSRGSICPLEVWIFSLKLVQKLHDYSVCLPVKLTCDPQHWPLGLSCDDCSFWLASVTVCSFGGREIVWYLAITISWIIPFKKERVDN